MTALPAPNHPWVLLVLLGLGSALLPSCLTRGAEGTRCSPRRSRCSRRITVPVQSFSNLQIRGEAAAVHGMGVGWAASSLCPKSPPQSPKVEGMIRRDHIPKANGISEAASPLPTIPPGSILLLRPTVAPRPTPLMRLIVFLVLHVANTNHVSSATLIPSVNHNQVPNLSPGMLCP